jgi:hypothetical protein
LLETWAKVDWHGLKASHFFKLSFHCFLKVADGPHLFSFHFT